MTDLVMNPASGDLVAADGALGLAAIGLVHVAASVQWLGQHYAVPTVKPQLAGRLRSVSTIAGMNRFRPKRPVQRSDVLE